MKYTGKEVNQMEMESLTLTEKMSDIKTKLDTVVVAGMLFFANAGFAFAEATDMWTQGTSAAQDVYGKVVGISTPIAAASLVILYLIRLFTHNQQNIDKSRTVSKAIAISWVVINGLGYVFVYAKSLIGTGGAVNFGMIMPYFNC